MTINDILKKYNLTQTEFSLILSIPLRTVQNWVSGVRTPPVYLIKLIDFYLSFQ